jgi:hypothetical protein
LVILARRFQSWFFARPIAEQNRAKGTFSQPSEPRSDRYGSAIAGFDFIRSAECQERVEAEKSVPTSLRRNFRHSRASGNLEISIETTD